MDTGSKGIHLMAPLAQKISHDAARIAARSLVQKLARCHPAKYLVASAPEARKGRIYLDYLRNGRGSTAIGTWSPRARMGFPIAAPVTWTQIERGIRPGAFSMKSPFSARQQKSVSGSAGFEN
jgi:bifunctional non-homologous end joining protein LigD